MTHLHDAWLSRSTYATRRQGKETFTCTPSHTCRSGAGIKVQCWLTDTG